MMRATVVAIIGLVIAAGLAAGYTFRWGAPTEQGVTGGVNETTIEEGTPGAGTPHGPMGQGMGPGAGHEGNCTHNGTAGPGGHGPAGNATMGAEAVCNDIGNMSVRDSIQWLLDNHYLFNYTLKVFDENRTIIWTITGPDRESLEVLYYHILQMECVIENGGTPRAQDPLFVVDAQISSKYVHTNVTFINDTAIRVVKVADNDCAFEVIKLHAEVVKGFFDTGRAEAMQTHEIPEEVAQLCEPYLNQTNTSP